MLECACLVCCPSVVCSSSHLQVFALLEVTTGSSPEQLALWMTRLWVFPTITNSFLNVLARRSYQREVKSIFSPLVARLESIFGCGHSKVDDFIAHNIIFNLAWESIIVDQCR